MYDTPELSHHFIGDNVDLRPSIGHNLLFFSVK